MISALSSFILAVENSFPEGGFPMPEVILIGDVIRSRKPHPCGGDEWTVIRTGADIKMKCNTCGRLVMMDRETFLRRRKALVSRPAPEQTP